MLTLKERKTWLITGGAGFIGSHLAAELVRQGQEVRIFDNFSSGKKARLAPLKNKIQIFPGDIRDEDALLQAFQGADYVLHHAAQVSVPYSVENPHETEEINVQGTARVLEAARQSGIKRLVFAASCAIYGNSTQSPYTEQTPQDCQSPYAFSKQAGIKLCQLYNRLYGLETVSLIYFNVFGSGQDPNSAYAAVIAKFMQQARQNQPLYIDWDGKQSRDFVHVQDVVQANLLAIIQAQPGHSYNVANGTTYSMLELADIIEKISGRRLERIFRPKRAGDIKISCADISKIQALGFRPSISLQQGLQEMWNK